MTVKGLSISEAEYDLKDGNKGKFAVFLYSGDEDPRPILDWAVENYTKGVENYYEFIDAHLDCPWLRMVMSNINDMEQLTWEEVRRDIQINKILGLKQGFL